MSTITRQRTSVFSALRSLFSSGIDIEGTEEIKLSEDLEAVLRSLSTKERAVEQAINVAGSSSKKGRFGKKINPNTEKAMRAMHKEVTHSIEDKER